MKYCSHCGKEVVDEAVVCPSCGCATGNTNVVEDVPSTGLNVLAFVFPVIGLIMYLMDKDKAPTKAKSMGKWALYGLIAEVVLLLLAGGL